MTHFDVSGIQVEVFWVVTPSSVAVGYRRFGGRRRNPEDMSLYHR